MTILSAMHTPQARYHADQSLPAFHADAAQARAVDHLQRLFDELIAVQSSNRGS